jgi:hypothetical protein
MDYLKCNQSRAFDFLYKKQVKFSTVSSILHSDKKKRKSIITELRRFRLDRAETERSSKVEITYPDLDLWAKGLETQGERNWAKRNILSAARKDASWWIKARRRGLLPEGLGVRVLQCRDVEEVKRLLLPFV